MALRLKTIEFATNTNVLTLAAATKRVFSGATQIFIPESTITFTSCMLEMFVATDAATAASLTAPTVGFSLGVAAESSSVLLAPFANSGEGECWIFSRDVTAYFTTNWTGTAMNWYAMWTGTGIVSANHAAKITITYQYEESTSDTQIKTIRIPIESTRTILTTTWQTVGSGATQAIPPLKGTYLPEIGITIRQIYLDIQSNDSMNAATNFSGLTRVNGGTIFPFWRCGISTLNSSRWHKSFYDITALNLTGSSYYSLEMMTSLTSRFDLPGGLITCTYEFDATGSTTIYNSLILGGIDTPGFIGGTTAALQQEWERPIYIEEPGPINIKESGVALYFIDSAGFTLNVQVTGNTSGQTAVSPYVVTAGALQCGQYSLFHRVDAGGQNRKGLYLARGKNLYNIAVYSGTADSGWNLSGALYLNYTSGKHADGVGAHAHTCHEYVMSGLTSTLRVTTSTTQVACPIPETNYYLIGFLTYLPYIAGIGTDQAITIQAEILPGELSNDGWVAIYQGQGRTDNENSLNTAYGAARTTFTRWNGDPDTDRLNLKSARLFRIDNNPINYSLSLSYYYTYNSIMFTVSGTCAGYSGDGSGIRVDVFRTVSSTYDEPILNLTTVAGGTFTGKWVDNTDTLFASARQDDTHVGRSTNGTAG
jgi:hypothetical protein